MDADMSTRRKISRLLLGCLLAVAAFIAYHFYLRELMLDTGLVLGAVRPGKKVYRIVPLYIYWRPRLKTGVLIAAAVLAAFVVWLRRSISLNRGAPQLELCSMSRVQFTTTLMLWHIAIAVSVALIDGGPKKLWDPYTIHRRSDYIGAVDKVVNPHDFLRDYSRLMPQLPLHCRTHPAGAPILLWAVAQFFGPGACAASIATILLGSLASPAVYLLARDVLDEGPARLAGGLFLLAPNIACYTATSMDAVFIVPLLWSFYFLWHGRHDRPLVWGAAGGFAASVAALMTFSTAFLALWAVVLVGLTTLFDRSRLKATLLTLGVALCASAVFYGLLYAWSNYNPIEVLGQAFIDQDEEMMGRGHSSLRQWFHFSVTNLVAFFVCTGLPLSLLWFRQTSRELRTTIASRARWQLLSFAFALLLFDLAPLYTIETERLWIFLVGFMAIGAATALVGEITSRGTSPLVLAVAILQAGQTILMETLLDWVW
jgi:hypothetical protein